MVARKVLILFFLVVSMFDLISSAENTYALKLGGGNTDVAAMINTADGGNVLLVNGNRLRKIDASGKKVWQKEYYPDSALRFQFDAVDLAQLSDGGYIVTGVKIDYDRPDPPENVLMKVTSTGKIDWEKSFDESGYGIGFFSVVANGNGFAAAGGRCSGSFLNPTCEVVVANFNSDGSPIWQQAFMSPDLSIYVLKLIKTSDQGFIVSCLFSDRSSPDTGGAFIFKLDADGNIQWKNLLQRKNFAFQAAASTSDAGALLLFWDRGVLDTGTRLQSVWVVRLSSGGSVMWKERFRVKGTSSQGLAVTQSVDGNFAVTGTIDSSAYHDGFIARLSPDGIVLSTVSFDVGSYDYPTFILPTSDAGYILHGYSDVSFLFKVNSELSLPGCLFQPAKSVRKKFGSLEISNPEISASNWNPEITVENDLHSRKYRVHDSPLCD